MSNQKKTPQDKACGAKSHRYEHTDRLQQIGWATSGKAMFHESFVEHHKTPFSRVEAYFEPDTVCDELARVTAWATDTKNPKAIENAYAVNIGVLHVCLWLCRLPGLVTIYDEGEYRLASPLFLVKEYATRCHMWLDRLNADRRGLKHMESMEEE